MVITPRTLVSIILPTYNGAKFLKRSIESVIAQTYTEWELIIIDDGSTDETSDIVTELQKRDICIRYIKNTHNLGIQKTLNKGLIEARGVYIARIDDDDIWVERNKLEQQITFLENNPKHVLIGCGVILIDEKEKETVRYLLPETDTVIRQELLSQNRFVHSSVVFRKSIAVELNGYSEEGNVRHVEDYDLWLRMGIRGMLANIPIYGVKLTIQESSISGRNKIDQFYKNIQLIKKYKEWYPGYVGAIIKGYLRIFLYKYLIKTPLKWFINQGVRFYKKYL